MPTIDEVKLILRDTLNLGGRAASLKATSRLLGRLPELDSLAVVTLVGAIEQHFGFMVEDDEISAETFATVASLSDFVERKLAEVSQQDGSHTRLSNGPC